MTFSVDVGVVIDVLPADVRVFDHLEAAVERPAVPEDDDRARVILARRACSPPACTWNRTVCDSSWRANLTVCCGGDAVQPGGRSSFTTLSAAALSRR